MRYLFLYLIVSCFALAFTLALVGARTKAVQRCIQGLLLAGLIGAALLLAGCSGSPTAPTSVVRFAWAVHPSCPATAANVRQLVGLADLGTSARLTDVPKGIWFVDGKTITVEFKRDNGIYWVCRWTEA